MITSKQIEPLDESGTTLHKCDTGALVPIGNKKQPLRNKSNHLTIYYVKQSTRVPISKISNTPITNTPIHTKAKHLPRLWLRLRIQMHPHTIPSHLFPQKPAPIDRIPYLTNDQSPAPQPLPETLPHYASTHRAPTHPKPPLLPHPLHTLPAPTHTTYTHHNVHKPICTQSKPTTPPQHTFPPSQQTNQPSQNATQTPPNNRDITAHSPSQHPHICTHNPQQTPPLHIHPRFHECHSSYTSLGRCEIFSNPLHKYESYLQDTKTMHTSQQYTHQTSHNTHAHTHTRCIGHVRVPSSHKII